MAKKEELREAIEESAYNADLIPDLQAYVKQSLGESDYELDLYLGLLRLYQYFPSRFNADTCKAVLAKTMTSFPENHFLLALYLLPDEHLAREDGPVFSLVRTAKILENCLFEEFWQERAKGEHKKLFDSIKGFDDAVRRYVLLSVTITF